MIQWRSSRWCPHCGATHTEYTPVTDLDRTPEPGDVAVCWDCGRVSFYTENGLLRKPTTDELGDVLGSPEVIEAIRKWEVMRMFYEAEGT